jgi:hypothetical protein
VNKPPDEKRSGRKLLERVERELAASLEIGKPDKIEQRRSKWITWSNVNIWFESLREFLVKEGFADDIADSPDEAQGEILFGENQTEYTVNLDESALILDNMPSVQLLRSFPPRSAKGSSIQELISSHRHVRCNHERQVSAYSFCTSYGRSTRRPRA